MQGVEGPDRELWDAAQVVGHLVPAGGMFAFLAEHRAEVFPDEAYADLFSTIGRPSIPATRMAAVLTLQALHELSDRECAEAVRCDLRWKVACGLSLLDEGFDPSSLVYWRKRIAESTRPHRVNDAVRQVIEVTGVLAGRRRRAVDSTILDDAVATQDTITQLIGAIRRVARQVPGAAEVIARVCTGHDYSGPGKPRIDWADPAAKQELVSVLVNDANAVVAALAGTELDEVAAAAVALLALVAGQDVEPAEGSDGPAGMTLWASIDVEWTKNYRIKNGNRPFCYSVVYVAVPNTAAPVDISELPFSYTSVYVEDPDETGALLASANNAVCTAFRAADRITGHQFTSDLGVLGNASPDPLPAVIIARETWLDRRNHDLADRRVIDTRYDTDHVLNCRSRRLVDVCTELRLDVTQPALRGTSMTALHRAWLTDRASEARDRVSVLNLRHSLSTAIVGLRATNQACWTGTLNVNRLLATGLDGAFTWLDHPTFTDLL